MPHDRKPVDLLRLESELSTLYSPWQNSVRRARSLFDKNFQNMPQVPDGVPIFASSRARNLVLNLADQLRTDEPRVLFSANGTSMKATKHKELMERWGEHQMDRIAREMIINPFEQAKVDLLRDGAACIKYTVDLDKLPEPPNTEGLSPRKLKSILKEWRLARADAWPYDIRAVDVMQVYPAPGRRQPPAFMLEVQRRFAWELADEYGHLLGDLYKGNQEMLRQVKWLEYWSAEHYIVQVENVTIIDKPNPYGKLPYIFYYNGRGRHDVTGSLALLGESILVDIEGEIEAEVRLKTAMDAQWQFHVFPRLITTMNERKARRMYMKGPGGIIKVDSMEQAPKWLEVTPPSPQMGQWLESIKADIADRFPPGLNQRPPGVEAAVHQALLQSSALKPLQPIKRVMNLMATDLINGLAYQARALNLDMNVYGTVNGLEKTHMVEAADFTDFAFKVSFEATDAAEDQRKILTGVAIRRLPRVLSRKTLREKFMPGLGIKHEEEEEQLLVEDTLDAIAASGLLVPDVVQAALAADQENQGEALMGAARGQAQGAVSASGQVPGRREEALGAIVQGATGRPGREEGLARREDESA